MGNIQSSTINFNKKGKYNFQLLIENENIVLDIKKDINNIILENSDRDEDPVMNAIKRFNNNGNKLIKNNINNNEIEILENIEKEKSKNKATETISTMINDSLNPEKKIKKIYSKMNNVISVIFNIIEFIQVIYREENKIENEVNDNIIVINNDVKFEYFKKINPELKENDMKSIIEHIENIHIDKQKNNNLIIKDIFKDEKIRQQFYHGKTKNTIRGMRNRLTHSGDNLYDIIIYENKENKKNEEKKVEYITIIKKIEENLNIISGAIYYLKCYILNNDIFREINKNHPN